MYMGSQKFTGSYPIYSYGSAACELLTTPLNLFIFILSISIYLVLFFSSKFCALKKVFVVKLLSSDVSMRNIHLLLDLSEVSCLSHSNIEMAHFKVDNDVRIEPLSKYNPVHILVQCCTAFLRAHGVHFQCCCWWITIKQGKMY